MEILTGKRASRNQAAVVTGGTGSLGRVLVKALLEQGVFVVVPYLDQARFRELTGFVGGGKDQLTGIAADVTREQDVQRLFTEAHQKHGRIDILLNIAGGYRGGTDVASTLEKDWDFLMDINLKSVFLCSRAVLPFMVKENYGRIVSVSARPAIENKGRIRSGAYAVSKAGIVVLMETIAEEYKKFNITAHTIVPSTIDTPANRRDFPAADSSKWVKPEEISAVVLFLISDEAAITNGASVPVYGKA